MTIAEWAELLDPNEKEYVKQCFKFWHNLDAVEPEIPDGIGRSKADLLRFHTKSLMEDSKPSKRKLEQLETITFKASQALHTRAAMDAAFVDVNLSIFIRTCILLASPIIKGNPRLVNFFSDSVIPK